MDRKAQVHIWYDVIAILGLLFLQDLYQKSKEYTAIPYSRFEQLLDQNKIDDIFIAQNTIRGTLKASEKEKDGLEKFVTTRVDPDFATQLDKHGVTYSGVAQDTLLSDILSWVVPIAWFLGKTMLFLFLYVWLRAALPRLRYDQLMDLGWKVLIPLSLGWVLLVASFVVGGLWGIGIFLGMAAAFGLLVRAVVVGRARNADTGTVAGMDVVASRDVVSSRGGDRP